MCYRCSLDGFDDYLDPYGIFGGYGGTGYGRGLDLLGGSDDFRAGFASVSKRALDAEAEAETAFLKHLTSVDTSKGPVTEEIIKFHLVPDMKKRFHEFVKRHGCTAKSRKLTRSEQDQINKTRKSLMLFTSVTVTPEAQKAYLDRQSAKKGGPSTSGASTSTAATSTANKVAMPLSPKPMNTLKRTANQALGGDAAAGPSKPIKKTKA